MQSRWAAMVFGDREDPRARLHAVFGGPAARSGQPPLAALEWAERTLTEADPARGVDPVTATRLLRRAEPRLTLKSGAFLAQHAVARRRPA
ncbi:hypothetical protein ACR8AL_06465 [Clavibacter sepedonicus]|uniref:Uncharacterized protein n=1 Tax=Clavibacter sepedonicus TaxID=31964 RepID=B0RG82_CLASE|nr:hypothetical protein [Clavibacter sepedonicus]UUK66366.1 hypothetical protein LRE50_03870 [Clavibacter sepedonicus]CAQ02374.1 hypothetical protein CMS2287 [Clavibacter sepedonicus]